MNKHQNKHQANSGHSEKSRHDSDRTGSHSGNNSKSDSHHSGKQHSQKHWSDKPTQKPSNLSQPGDTPREPGDKPMRKVEAGKTHEKGKPCRNEEYTETMDNEEEGDNRGDEKEETEV